MMTLKEQLERGEYQIDATKVADAVIRSPLWFLLLAGGGSPPSKPALGG